MKKIVAGLSAALCMLILSAITFAQGAGAQETFVPLAGIPGVTGQGNMTLSGYLQALFTLLISVAIMIAVVKITIAGIKYMAAAGNMSSTEEAKKDIRASLLGLLLILASVLILNTINPCITKFNIFSEGDQSCFNRNE